ncbi:ADP-ribosylglycohydrolase family protein [Marinactinospora rubrisoli]|uniref:ADP-ribosylglycohydrolase family protein n=1 Tax=Marinactinospora rubrisoli TaxID=2715399 RepID=A0ABW2KMY0_9ACTN
MDLVEYRSRVRGCLLGGAVGDALGAPVEFTGLAAIRERFGAAGVREFTGGVHGAITDDTQMTLWTVEGLIRAGVRRDRGLGFNPVGPVHHAYFRWYDTQVLAGPPARGGGWLQDERWLYARRAPGNTCMGALGRDAPHFGAAAANDSKGCGGVMRSAPFGLLPYWRNSGPAEPDRLAFQWAADAAGLTHGHPTGKLASGALAVLIARLVAGAGLEAALDAAMTELAAHEHHEETTRALRHARAAAADRPATAETVEELGGGWIAEEALAIAVFAALKHPEPGPDAFLNALALAVSHSGDSDSTGAICGNILGALHGEPAVPPELAFEVEGRATILVLADDFVYEFTSPQRLHDESRLDGRWRRRYPGG